MKTIVCKIHVYCPGNHRSGYHQVYNPFHHLHFENNLQDIFTTKTIKLEDRRQYIVQKRFMWNKLGPAGVFPKKVQKLFAH